MVTFTQDFHHLLMTFIISRSDIKAKMLMSSTIDEIIEFYQGPSHFYHSYLNKVGPCIFLRGWWGGGVSCHSHINLSTFYTKKSSAFKERWSDGKTSEGRPRSMSCSGTVPRTPLTPRWLLAYHMLSS